MTDPAPTALPPSETVYVRNLNEKIKVDELKTTLRQEFESFGPVLDVVAHKNLRMRGQAFVVFESIEDAKKAQQEMRNREVFGKPMIVQFAKTKSDATIAQAGNEDALEKHKRRRLAAKELRQVEDNKRKKTKTSSLSSSSKGTTGSGSGSRKSKKDQNDFLPPSDTLFLQDLPAGVKQATVEAVFNQYKGYVEVRLMAVRRLGFVEFETDEDAVAAKEDTAGLVLEGSQVQITYAKK